jgi:hypothetical protein
MRWVGISVGRCQGHLVNFIPRQWTFVGACHLNPSLLFRFFSSSSAFLTLRDMTAYIICFGTNKCICGCHVPLEKEATTCTSR